MRLFLDADEVLFETIEAGLAMLNPQYGTHYVKEDVKMWNFTDVFPDMTHDTLDKIFDRSDFIDYLQFKKGAITTLEKYRDNICIVTKGNPKGLEVKKELLKFHGFGDIQYIGVPIGESKGCVDMSDGIFVDDSQCNLWESNADVKILFENVKNAEWNSHFHGLKVRSHVDLSFLLNYYIKN